MKTSLLFAAVGCLACLGCADTSGYDNAPTRLSAPEPLDDAASDEAPPEDEDVAPVDDAEPSEPEETETPADEPPDDETAAAQPGEPEYERVGAVRETGRAGDDYQFRYFRVAVNTYFGVQEMVIFNQAKQTADMYRAEHGHYPKTSEEGLKFVADAGHRLPELDEEDERYEFDPETGEIYVLRPKN